MHVHDPPPRSLGEHGGYDLVSTVGVKHPESACSKIAAAIRCMSRVVGRQEDGDRRYGTRVREEGSVAGIKSWCPAGTNTRKFVADD
jgi:hypothetical protein